MESESLHFSSFLDDMGAAGSLSTLSSDALRGFENENIHSGLQKNSKNSTMNLISLSKIS